MKVCCFQWFKDTNLKANHNASISACITALVVSNGSKILIWKQITTTAAKKKSKWSCFQWFKDTNLKANHNYARIHNEGGTVVSNGSKILIWKQITTALWSGYRDFGCFQWFKDTNLKANHNYVHFDIRWVMVVSNGSKILIWKQITTTTVLIFSHFGCFQWFKDTNLKANHNKTDLIHTDTSVVSNGSKILIWKQITTAHRVVLLVFVLFPMVQRY